ncbi:MAG: VOC family protein [Bacteroidetes bacterium]|nr:VOC family protein [Bacteroidota bacterium]
MTQKIVQIAIVVKNYDEAISFYTDKLGFVLLEDKVMSETKRWVRVAPKGDPQFSLLLAQASGEKQEQSIGNQAGGRVFIFMHTDDLMRDYAAMKSKGVIFVREPVVEEWGTVAVFSDLYGNLFDLIEPSKIS